MVEILIVAGPGWRDGHGRDRAAGAPGAGPDPGCDDTWPGSHRPGLALPAVMAGWEHPLSTPRCRPRRSCPGLGQIGSQLYLYYVVLVVLVLVLAAAATLRRSAVGRVIIATRDNERAIASFGIKPSVVKLRVLALSGFVAATRRGVLCRRLAERHPTLLHC